MGVERKTSHNHGYVLFFPRLLVAANQRLAGPYSETCRAVESKSFEAKEIYEQAPFDSRQNNPAWCFSRDVKGYLALKKTKLS